ncbi:MAG: hypothetical protein H7330_02735 [Hymenobacteraceae bacterium]|nr:hypothetical protein [Hymenobacteraceae bacterium]
MEQASPPESAVSGWIYAANDAPILRYEVEQSGRVLHVEWQHGPLIDDVKFGFLEVARLLASNQYPVILSDSNHSIGDWSELIPWVRYEFLPLAIANGLRYLVDVLPIDPANSFSVTSWHEETRGLLHHEIFTSLPAARRWIAGRFPAQAE